MTQKTELRQVPKCKVDTRTPEVGEPKRLPQASPPLREGSPATAGCGGVPETPEPLAAPLDTGRQPHPGAGRDCASRIGVIKCVTGPARQPCLTHRPPWLRRWARKPNWSRLGPCRPGKGLARGWVTAELRPLSVSPRPRPQIARPIRSAAKSAETTPTEGLAQFQAA